MGLRSGVFGSMPTYTTSASVTCSTSWSRSTSTQTCMVIEVRPMRSRRVRKRTTSPTSTVHGHGHNHRRRAAGANHFPPRSDGAGLIDVAEKDAAKNRHIRGKLSTWIQSGLGIGVPRHHHDLQCEIGVVHRDNLSSPWETPRMEQVVSRPERLRFLYQAAQAIR
jgi:hypothetical protein